MTAIKGEREAKRRGSSRARRSLIPRLALWAGVGVFIFGLYLGCDDDGPTEPTPTPPTPSGEGFVWAAMANAAAERWLIKVDIGTGEIHRTGVEGFNYGEWVVGLPVVEETGEFFLHKPSFFLARYNAIGELVWRKGETPYNWRDYSSIAYYAKGNVLWGMEDKGWLEKRSGADGNLIAYKEIPELSGFQNPPIQIDQRNGAVWAASHDYLVKLSSGGGKLYEEQFNSSERAILNLAIERRTGNLWVLVRVGKPAVEYKLLKYSPAGDRLLTKDTFLIQEPTGIGVDPYKGEVWLGYQYGVVVHKSNGDYKKSVPNYNNVRAFAFTDTKVIMGGGVEERSYCLYGVNKGTGMELWSITGGYRPVICVNYVNQ